MTTEQLIALFVGLLTGSGGIWGIFSAREKRRTALDKARLGAADARDVRMDDTQREWGGNFLAYLQAQIDRADARHAVEMEQRERVLAKLDEARADAEKRATAAEARAWALQVEVTRLEAEVAELRRWRQSVQVAAVPDDTQPSVPHPARS